MDNVSPFDLIRLGMGLMTLHEGGKPEVKSRKERRANVCGEGGRAFCREANQASAGHHRGGCRAKGVCGSSLCS